MKHSLLALTLIVLSSVAQADISEKFQENCNTPEAKALMGETGSCRIVVAPKSFAKQGLCMGTFMGSLPCALTFVSVSGAGAAMNLKCGTDPKKPMIDQMMAAEAVGYNVTTMIKNAAGQDIVLNDENEYGQITSRMVDLYLTDSSVNGVTTSSASIYLALQSGPVALTNVICK